MCLKASLVFYKMNIDRFCLSHNDVKFIYVFFGNEHSFYYFYKIRWLEKHCENGRERNVRYVIIGIPKKYQGRSKESDTLSTWRFGTLFEMVRL